MPESVTTFSAIALAIFVEAMPFLAVGALLSAAIEVFVPQERLASWLPKGTVAGIALGAAAGMLLPTCECGVVPVARRLMDKGVPPHVAVAYMLAAPVVNPVVLVSTWVAFQGKPSMVAGRFALVDPDTALDDNLQQEWTLEANWFFNGHRNKLSGEVSRIILDAPDGEASETRLRFQWDVSF